MFAEQIHSRIVLNNLNRKKEYFVIAFYIKKASDPNEWVIDTVNGLLMQIAICIIMDRRLYKTSSRGISVRYHRESIYGINTNISIFLISL